MELSFNKDDKNVGTVSERVFAGRDSPSVKKSVFVKVHYGTLSRTCELHLVNSLLSLQY